MPRYRRVNLAKYCCTVKTLEAAEFCNISINFILPPSSFKMIQSCIILLLVAACSVHANVTSTACQKEIASSYLDIAIDMITKAKYKIPTCDDCPKLNQTCDDCPKLNQTCDDCPKLNQTCDDCPKLNQTCDDCPKLNQTVAKKPLDCADVLEMGHNKSGIYEIWPLNRVTEGKHLNVYCDMDTNGGGWTVIQRRGDFQKPKDYFYQDWKSYKGGFGEIEKDFWLGNNNIFALTNQKLYSIRFDLKDFQGNIRYALYDNFWIADEDHNYTLHISNYSGDAGDSMAFHNNQPFTTKDRNNDRHTKSSNCAELRKGGWWYKNCYQVNLNGFYHKGKYNTGDGISWKTWKGNDESLAWTEMKIRPKNFRLSFS